MTKIDEVINIIKALGLPKAQQNERSALTLLALTNVKKKTPWKEAKFRPIGIHDMIIFIEKNYEIAYAENTRESIRRQTIHQFEQAGIVVRNPDDPLRPTNSPKTSYAVSKEALDVIRQYGSKSWKKALSKFIEDKGKLVDRYDKRKKKHLMPVDLPDGTHVDFTPGKHNELQVKILTDFRARFCPNTKVVYVGDTARKMLYLNEELLSTLKIPITKHDKLPDVVLYNEENNNLLLIEAVTAHGPISPKRQIELEKALGKFKTNRIYISAFPDFKEFKRHIDNIAWDTEVWIEENPGHMIHFNGPKFFTVYET